MSSIAFKKGLIMNFPFEQFISLVQFDKQLHEKEKQIACEQEALLVLEQKKHTLTGELALLKELVHQAQKDVDAYELEAKTLDGRETTLKHKLDTLTNIKEYEPLKRELDGVQEGQMALENVLVTAWNRLESSQRTMQQKEPEIVQHIADARHLVEKKEADVVALQEVVAEAKKEREIMFGTIPAEWLEKYEHMRGLVADPVVPVQQGACSGCFYTISDQDILRLKKRALLQCKDCYRFLYDPEALQAL